ncbi:hypothetical protein [Kocuria marina]|nr:hypothetical protein [Kocuria marina]
MNENTISGNIELSVGEGIYPIQAKVGASASRRFGSRSEEVLKPVVEK